MTDFDKWSAKTGAADMPEEDCPPETVYLIMRLAFESGQRVEREMSYKKGYDDGYEVGVNRGEYIG